MMGRDPRRRSFAGEGRAESDERSGVYKVGRYVYVIDPHLSCRLSPSLELTRSLTVHAHSFL